MRTIIVIILLVLGLIALGLGIYYLVYSSIKSNYDFSSQLTDGLEERVLEYDSPYYVLDRDGNQTHVNLDKFDLVNQTYIKYTIAFKTKDVFAEDNRIDYSIQARAVGKPVIDTIALFIEKRGIDYSKIDKANFNYILDSEKSKTSIILQKMSGKILKSDMNVANDTITLPLGLTYYHAESFFTVPRQQEITLHPFLNRTDGTLYRMESASDLITINPAYTKLQAETNRILVNNTQTQARTNDTNLGLTLVVIAGIPISIGIQVILDNSKKHALQNKADNIIIKNNLSRIERYVAEVYSRVTGLYKRDSES